jgi:hypothetical protein
LGCGPAIIVEEGDESSSSSASATGPEPGTSSSAGGSAGPVSTPGNPTTTPPMTTASPTTATVTTAGSTGFETEGGLPNGQPCMSDLECGSGMCFLSGILGGICGECLGDDDCEWGCTGPNPLSDPPEGSFCNSGLFGEGCQSSDACMGVLVCATILDVPGVLLRNTCSQCLTDAECAGDLCSPDIDVSNLDGARSCVAPFSKPLGSFCDLGDGDECSSGHCGIADINGLVQLGVCSDCTNDDDCVLGDSCFAPTVDLDGTIFPGYCE